MSMGKYTNLRLQVSFPNGVMNFSQWVILNLFQVKSIQAWLEAGAERKMLLETEAVTVTGTCNKFLTVWGHYGGFLKETGSKKDERTQKVIRHSCFVIIFNI